MEEKKYSKDARNLPLKNLSCINFESQRNFIKIYRLAESYHVVKFRNSGATNELKNRTKIAT